MHSIKYVSYREIPFCSGTKYNDFYIYIDLEKIPDKCKNLMDAVIKCRTLGILQSVNGRFYLSDYNTSGINHMEPLVQVSMVYMQSPPPSTVIPYPVQIFGTLQWKNKPVIFAKIIQIINVSTAIRLKKALRGVISAHLVTSEPQNEESEDPT